jgi:hypothetical protein
MNALRYVNLCFRAGGIEFEVVGSMDNAPLVSFCLSVTICKFVRKQKPQNLARNVLQRCGPFQVRFRG